MDTGAWWATVHWVEKSQTWEGEVKQSRQEKENRYKCPQVRKKLMQVVSERHSKQDRLGIRLESYTGNKRETVSIEQSNRVIVPEYLGHFKSFSHVKINKETESLSQSIKKIYS